MLKSRIISAALLIPVVLGIVWFSPLIYFNVVLSIFILLAAWEWSKLAHWSSWLQSMAYVVIMIVCLSLVMVLSWQWLLIVPVVTWLICFYMVFARAFDWKIQFRQSWCSALIGWVILPGAWLSLSWLKHGDQGGLWVTFTLSLTWAADTGAYFSGKFLGQGRGLLLPRVSPKKTWVGVFGGILLVFLVTGLFLIFYAPWRTYWVQFFLLDLVIVFAAVMGDLFESVLKRVAGVKDSGAIIPGHGGILDRIDSLLATAPVIFCAIKLFGL